ncbi:HAMP domain-containing histidine kinase [Agrobacterium rhizogenes]|nr:HAMP domain-containing histidine kinase [Rhizobium rhizogenes]
MAGLIDNVLDFARGRLGGGIGLVRETNAPLEPVLIQVVEELRAGAPERTILTEYSLTEPVSCDRSRIGQLVSNLLGKALTHGAADKPVRLQAFTIAGVLEISVANGGLPISEKARLNLFQPFFRGEVRGASRVSAWDCTSPRRSRRPMMVASRSSRIRLRHGSRSECQRPRHNGRDCARWPTEISFIRMFRREHLLSRHDTFKTSRPGQSRRDHTGAAGSKLTRNVYQSSESSRQNGTNYSPLGCSPAGLVKKIRQCEETQ